MSSSGVYLTVVTKNIIYKDEVVHAMCKVNAAISIPYYDYASDPRNQCFDIKNFDLDKMQYPKFAEYNSDVFVGEINDIKEKFHARGVVNHYSLYLFDKLDCVLKVGIINIVLSLLEHEGLVNCWDQAYEQKLGYFGHIIFDPISLESKSYLAVSQLAHESLTVDNNELSTSDYGL